MPPQNWIQQALQNQPIELPPDAAGVVLGMIGNQNITTKKGQPKTTEPPIELNLKAKKPEQWVPITTYGQYLEARQQGKLIGYTPYVQDKESKEWVYASKPYTKGQIDTRLAHGMWVHNTQKVGVYGPVLYNTGIVTIWVGRTHEEFLFEKENNPYFVKLLNPLSQCIYEGATLV